MFDLLEDLIDKHVAAVENNLDIAELTINYGLHSFTYGTSEFLKDIFTTLSLQDDMVFYDLGSGYGKVLLYGAINFPGVHFKGIEILEERDEICRQLAGKFGLKNISTECIDILSAELDDGDVFYIYNSLYNFQYGGLLDKLKVIAESKPIKVIAESRCDVFDTTDWLKVYHTQHIDILRKIKYYQSI